MGLSELWEDRPAREARSMAFFQTSFCPEKSLAAMQGFSSLKLGKRLQRGLNTVIMIFSEIGQRTLYLTNL